MIRRVFFALVFGALVSWLAAFLGETEHSLIQAIFVGLISAMGFMGASSVIRGRVRSRQGKVPSLRPGETAGLYGPGQFSDMEGTSEAWFYLSNQRLMFRNASGEGLDLRLDEIEELRPPQVGMMGGRVFIVAKGRGLLTLKVPDSKRWYRAIFDAIHRKKEDNAGKLFGGKGI